MMKRNDVENRDELATKSGRLWGAISRQTEWRGGACENYYINLTVPSSLFTFTF